MSTTMTHRLDDETYDRLSNLDEQEASLSVKKK